MHQFQLNLPISNISTMAAPTLVHIKTAMAEDNLTLQEWLRDDGNVYISSQLKKYSEDKNAKDSLWCHRNLSFRHFKEWITTEEYLEQYEKFVRKRLWCKLDDLENKTLGCWCEEKENCHGNVIIKLFKEKKQISPY